MNKYIEAPIPANLWNVVLDHFRDKDKTRLWFETKNPLLGDLSPSDMIAIGRVKKLEKFIENAIAENSL